MKPVFGDSFPRQFLGKGASITLGPGMLGEPQVCVGRRIRPSLYRLATGGAEWLWSSSNMALAKVTSGGGGEGGGGRNGWE